MAEILTDCSVAGWPEKLISYNKSDDNAVLNEVAGWPEKLICYNSSKRR